MARTDNDRDEKNLKTPPIPHSFPRILRNTENDAGLSRDMEMWREALSPPI